jgi:hypothetical protein
MPEDQNSAASALQDMNAIIGAIIPSIGLIGGLRAGSCQVQHRASSGAHQLRAIQGEVPNRPHSRRGVRPLAS